MNRIHTLEKTSGHRRVLNRKESIAGYLFAAPSILGFLIFTLGPMVISLVLSFTDYQIVRSAEFVGTDNYETLFSGNDPYFYPALQASLTYVAMSIPVNMIFSFIVAMLLNYQNIHCRSFFRTVFYLPSIVPVVASSMVWMWLLNPDFGLANIVLKALGLKPSMWLFSEQTVIPSLVLVGVWSTGNVAVIFLSGLQGIPRHLYEAVDVDGGGFFHKLFHITIPMMTPVIFYNLVLGLINGFQVFAQPYIMTSGGPNNKSLMYVFFLYRETFQFSRMGYGCAIAWVLFIIIAGLSAVIFSVSNRWVFYSGGEN